MNIKNIVFHYKMKRRKLYIEKRKSNYKETEYICSFAISNERKISVNLYMCIM